MGLSEITGIKLKGANFEIETSLQLLHSNKEPALGLVYGKNGAGKSTISRAFSKLAGKQEDTIETAFAINGKAEDIILTDEDRSNIHVFNEQYVDNNIKFRPDDKGLETIVVLGRANDIERDMDMAQKAVDEQKQKVEKQKELCDLYEDEKSEKSPHYHIKKVRDALKGEGAWGGRDAKIQGHIRATSTREDTYKNFISRKPQKKRDELIAEFDNKLINNAVREFNSSRRNEYTQLMINIYKYAKGENADYELVVGNSMRRVMEAYGSFMYKKGIEQLSTASEIKQKLEPPFGDHFENLMYRLVLHGGSHNEERVKSMVSDDFFDYISSEEKIRTAKEILVFLYTLDDQHVIEHLKRDLNGKL